jgi:DNA-binding PadR family transcriptional regulator
MKVYTITDRHLREFAQVIGEEARRPLLEFIRNLMREMQAAAEEMAELRKENTVGGDDAPAIAPRE